MGLPPVQPVLQFSDAPDAVGVQKRPPDHRELIEAVAKVNKSGLLGQDKELTFLMDRDVNRPIIRIVNRKTKELVLQIPPEYVLNVAKALERAE
jgi:flagellar protein FlaG